MSAVKKAYRDNYNNAGINSPVFKFGFKKIQVQPDVHMVFFDIAGYNININSEGYMIFYSLH